MASKKDGNNQQSRLHYGYAQTGNVPGVGSIGGTGLPKKMQHAKGGRIRKARGRGC